MGRGILSGLFWGSVISIAVLGSVSQLAPLPGETAKAGRTDGSATGDASGTPADVDDGTGDASDQMARLETPEPENAPQTPVTEALAPATQSDTGKEREPGSTPTPDEALSSSVSVPAGSEFRRPPPESEATLPDTDSSLAGPQAPVKPREADGEAAVDLSGTSQAIRPETPGMSVAAPVAPEAGDEAPTMADPAADAPELAEGPASSVLAAPEAEPTESMATSIGTEGFPPPVTPEAVSVDTAMVVDDAATETPAQEAKALAAEVASRAETAAADAAEPVATDRVQAATADTALDAAPDSAAPVTPETYDKAGESIVVDAVDQPAIGTQEPQTAATVAGNAKLPTQTAEVAPEQSVEGDVVASLDNASSVAPEVASERAGISNAAAPVAPADETSTTPATQPAKLPAGGDAPDTPERKEAKLAGPDETPPQVGETPTSRTGVRVMPLTDRSTGGSRLPQIGIDPQTGATLDASVDTADARAGIEGDAALSDSAPRLDALSRNAAPFTNPEGKPLLSVILVDDGTGGLDRNVLTTFSFPVTFAIDPTRSDATQAAETYAGQGFEVVALATGLAGAEQPRDVEVTLEAHLAAVPQAVAIMDPTSGGFGKKTALAEHVLQIAADDGHGVIGWDKGLSTVTSLAARNGHPAAVVYRALDADDEKSPVIRRYLDRATFQAAQDGTVVMVGRARPETVKALFKWASSRKADQVTLAPISAVLRQP